MIQTTYLKTKKACKVKFTFNGALAQKVEVLGLNNDWENPVALSKKKDGSFSGEVSLPVDTKQEFKYRVDDTEWVNDPEADSESPNGLGSTNSVLNI